MNNQDDRDTLLPCPFCGEKDDLGDYRDQYPNSEVLCGNCGAHAHGDTWNTRKGTDEKRIRTATLAEVKEEIVIPLGRGVDCGKEYNDGYYQCRLDTLIAIYNLRGRDEQNN